MPKKSTNIVVGGGVTGLYAAYRLAKRQPEVTTVVIEASERIGGLLRSVSYPKYGRFDYGVHTFYETSIPEIDVFFQESTPEGDWKYLEGYDRDLGGVVYQNTVMTEAPFLDLRKLGLSEDVLAKYKEEVLAVSDKDPDQLDPDSTAEEYLVKRFGPSVYRDFFANSIELKQGLPSQKVNWIAARIQGIQRVVLFDEPELIKRMQGSHLSARAAFPNQHSYPTEFLPAKRAYYPKKYGIQGVIDAIEQRILQLPNVKIMCNARVSSASVVGKRIEHVVVQSADQQMQFEIDHLLWTAHPVPLQRLLSTSLNGVVQPPNSRSHKKTIICNLVVSEKPKSNGVYYLYSHDEKHVHRISFPDNFTDEDYSHGFRICVECIYDADESDEHAVNQTIAYLVKSDIIPDKACVVFAAQEKAVGGYPNLDNDAVMSLHSVQKDLADLQIENLLNIGMLSKPNLFFQFDLIHNAHEMLG